MLIHGNSNTTEFLNWAKWRTSGINAVECFIPHETLFPKTGFRDFNLPQVKGLLTLKIWLKD